MVEGVKIVRIHSQPEGVATCYNDMPLCVCVLKRRSQKKTRLPGSLLHEKFIKACRGGRLDDVEQLVLGSSTAIDVNQPSNDRKTALFHAITSRSLPLVRFLLKCGADVRKRSFVFFRLDCSAFNFESCDEPPLVTASRSGSTDILRCLLQVPLLLHSGARHLSQPLGV